MKFYKLTEERDGEEVLLAYVADSEEGNPVAAFWQGPTTSNVMWPNMAAFEQVSMGANRNILLPRTRSLIELADLPVSMVILRRWYSDTRWMFDEITGAKVLAGGANAG